MTYSESQLRPLNALRGKVAATPQNVDVDEEEVVPQRMYFAEEVVAVLLEQAEQ